MFDKLKVGKARKNRRATSALQKSLEIAANEKDVENAYRQAISHYFPSKIRSPFNVDGLLECDDVRSLLEFKHNIDLKLKIEQCNVLIQALIYLKRLEQAGKKLPTTVFVGDQDECFCMRTDALIRYLSLPIDWSVAPSVAHKKLPETLRAMVDDHDILPFIFDVNRKAFDFGELVDQIELLGRGVIHQVKISEENCVEIFNYWRSHVLTDEKLTTVGLLSENQESEARKLTARQSDLFFACLTDKDSTYLHPTKKNCLVSRGEHYRVNANQHRSFFAHFSQILAPSELDILVANKDRIIDEVSRRRSGAYFTTALWAAEAHKMLDESLGANWREEYVVWDCAAGTANLTRDFQFKELYISTLEQGDIDTIRDMGYNPGATIFQYDFLNDDEADQLGEKIPKGLKRAFAEKRKVLFLINPPYGTEGTMKHGTTKAGVGKTRVNAEMVESKMGHCCRQLYAQFMYRIGQLMNQNQNVSLALFAPPLFASGQSFSKMRSFWNGRASFSIGMLFQASNFSDVSDNWGISFTIWKPASPACFNDSMDISLRLKELDVNTFQIKEVGTKRICSPHPPITGWCGDFSKLKWEKSLRVSSAIQWKRDEPGENAVDALGWMFNKSNNVYFNTTHVAMFSSRFSDFGSAGIPVMEENFRKVMALFCARKTIERTWINWQDEYLVPNTAHPDYEQWVNDAIVYSLFNSKSNQSSLRDIKLNGDVYNILNHFFFLPAKEMKELANETKFNEIYQDVKVHGGKDRYVYEQLEAVKLSTDAREVLESARELVRKSMPTRKQWHDDKPKLHLQAWDAGWAQLKPMLKVAHSEDYKKFVEGYKAFEARMRKGVYEFGFLK